MATISKTTKIIQTVKDVIFISSAITALVSFISYNLWYFVKDPIIEQIREELGISQLATKEDFDKLNQRVATILGEDQVIHIDYDRSYVEEPVFIHSDEIVLILYIARTEIGAECQLEKLTPIIEDSRGVRTAATTRQGSIQLTTALERIRLIIPLPEGMAAGRTTISYSLTYNCEGQTKFEKIRPIAFYILPD